jgi:hypothetical protein
MDKIKKQVVDEIHKQARINFPRRRVIVKSLNDLFQADLVEMIPYSGENNGFKYILVVINCFSKFVWAFPLKTKTGYEVVENMEKVFKQQQPKNLQTDMGKEFLNKTFQLLMKKYNINHYNTYSEKKASIVERVNRTLKNLMWKEFNYHGHYRWINLLDNIVQKYNNSKHRTIGMKPSEVKKTHEKKLLNTVYNRIKIVNLSSKFHVGDHVRISKTRGVFDKKYMPNWSTEIFTIKKILLTNPNTYLLQDYQKQDIKGCFYQQQLQKVKHPDVYLVEKILRRKNNKVFVKWLGFDSTHNSWIDKTKIV